MLRWIRQNGKIKVHKNIKEKLCTKNFFTVHFDSISLWTISIHIICKCVFFNIGNESATKTKK